MSVKDVIKSSILKGLSGGMSLGTKELLLILTASCIMGVYIFVVYKNFSKSEYYSKDLNVTLAGVCVVVAAIMIAMRSNIVVSLGMVGALSIVRFRTAIKNPIDLLYLFWAISVGIISGVGLYILGILLCVIMTLMIWVLNLIPVAKAPILLIIRTQIGADMESVNAKIKSQCSFSHQDSIMTRNNENELIYEIKTKDKIALVNSINSIPGVVSISCLEHDGEIRM